MGRSEREKMMSGELYLASDPELVAARSKARHLVRDFEASIPNDATGRRRILEKLLGHLGADVFIEPPFRCDYGLNIFLGDHVYMNFGCVLLDAARIDIGEDTLLGPHVQLYTATHPVDAAERIKGPEYAKPIKLGARVWLGGNTIVLPGVTIGDGTTVGAGSVVTRDLPANVVAAGNPCRVIRTL